MPEEFFQLAGLLTGSGPDAQPVVVRLSDIPGDKYIEASTSIAGGSNVHIIAGLLSLAECQNRLERGWVDFVLTVPTGSGVRRRLPTDIRQLTVFFEGANSSGQTQLVNIKVVRYP